MTFWRKLDASARSLPSFDDFDPGDRSHDPQRIVVWSVKEKKGGRTFAPTYKGAHILEAFGRRVYLEMIASQALRDLIMSGLEDCAESRQAIYMIIEAPDEAGEVIQCERLLLPFGNGGASVSHIFAAIEVSSLAGTIDRRTIVSRFETDAQITLRGRITGVAPADPGHSG